VIARQKRRNGCFDCKCNPDHCTPHYVCVK
jgi:hypothetical protein